jgi:hemoglobin/transferrin/lactoferrin receptor protein
VLSEEAPSLAVDFALELGSLRTEVTVSAARGERDTLVVPVRTDTVLGELARQLAMPSIGDAMLALPGVTPVGSGPFQVRPRLRGLDSTRVLVLVDGERLNNARTATDRAGIEVGLVSMDAIERVEVLGGAGSVLYGTDALSGTINLVTNQPRFSDRPRFSAGFDGLYSSNENGSRGTLSLGYSDRRWAVSFMGGAERFEDYRAGRSFSESSQPFFDSGRLVQTDTIDTNFGFSFNAFPEPFNAPFTRPSADVPSSSMEGSSYNLSGRVQLTGTHALRVRYQRREATDVGFPDFASPFFFQEITLPWSRLDKTSVNYSITNLASWFPRLTATAYYQKQDRLLRNELPVQFAAPTPVTFLPINVFRLNVESNTRQVVATPGVEVQATFLTRANNVLTAGVTIFRDRSEDERHTLTEATIIGNVAMGPFGPRATVFPTPIVLGTEAAAPVRVPDSSFRDIGLFVHDELDVSPVVRLTAGVRVDAYRVTTDPTAGYSVDELTTGATPPIDPSTLPNVSGDRISRTAVTGEAGVVLWATRPLSVFGHYVRSYRHPNLEELLFSGPATAGNIVPNITVEPETGHNLDVGVRMQAPWFRGSTNYFINHYHGFISTEVVSTSPAGTISQAINLARVRIQGVEAEADVPVAMGGLLWMPFAQAAWTRGTVLDGTSPHSGLSLDGAPQDNITPWKISTGLRVSDRQERWWGSYGVRAQGDVSRVSPLLSESPFLIAQDLLALDGFAIHRLAGGYTWRRGENRLGVSLAIDNLTDRFYREHFQFAPARGRSVSVAVTVR